MKTQCEREISELHQFFEDWFTGKLSTDKEFARLENVLAEDFFIITPSARQTQREPLLRNIKNTNGAFKKPDHTFNITIKNIECRYQQGDLCLFTYEEWQEQDGQTNGRVSSVLFHKKKGTPNGVAWMHVHEVAIPSD